MGIAIGNIKVTGGGVGPHIELQRRCRAFPLRCGGTGGLKLSPRERPLLLKCAIEPLLVTRQRDEASTVNHSKMVILALTLAAWWLQLRQYLSGRLRKGPQKDRP